MKWTDVSAIAEAPFEKYPDVDPASVRFVDLYNRVVGLEGFRRRPHARRRTRTGSDTGSLDR